MTDQRSDREATADAEPDNKRGKVLAQPKPEMVRMALVCAIEYLECRNEADTWDQGWLPRFRQELENLPSDRITQLVERPCVCGICQECDWARTHPDDDPAFKETP